MSFLPYVPAIAAILTAAGIIWSVVSTTKQNRQKLDEIRQANAVTSLKTAYDTLNETKDASGKPAAIDANWSACAALLDAGMHQGEKIKAKAVAVSYAAQVVYYRIKFRPLLALDNCGYEATYFYPGYPATIRKFSQFIDPGALAKILVFAMPDLRGDMVGNTFTLTDASLIELEKSSYDGMLEYLRFRG